MTLRLTTRGRGGATSQEVTYLTRAGNVRADLVSPVGPVTFLSLATEGKAYLLMASQKSYMELPANGVSDDRSAAGMASRGEVTVRKTGRMETVAGYPCEHVLVVRGPASGGNAPADSTDVCFTRALGTYVDPMASAVGRTNIPAWQQALLRDGGFPLKVTLADGTVALEATRVEKKRVSPAVFGIPSDYGKVPGRRP